MAVVRLRVDRCGCCEEPFSRITLTADSRLVDLFPASREEEVSDGKQPGHELATAYHTCRCVDVLLSPSPGCRKWESRDK